MLTIAGDTNGDFAVNVTGFITVAGGKTLNMATTASYTLTVTATAGSLTDLAEVTVTVAADCSGSAGVLSSSIIAMAAMLMINIVY